MERVSVDAEELRCFTSISVGVRKHYFKKRFLKNLSDFGIEFAEWRVGCHALFNVCLEQGVHLSVEVPRFAYRGGFLKDRIKVFW